MKSKHLIILVIIASVLASCASHVKTVDEDVCTKCVGFIKDGKTTKAELLQQEDFYTHTKTFNTHSKTIMVFNFWVVGTGMWGNKYKSYDLVLVFDENDILQKHSVVQVR
jgi:hypothetical protein